MSKCVAITGIGLVNPLGIGKKKFWDNLIAGKNAVQIITRFDPKHLPVQVAGQIDGFNPKDFLPSRLAVKMDRFAHYAVAASKLALDDADIDLQEYDPYRVGVWFGNNAGGWDICERGLFELYRDGAPFVNPWQATAWFPTSPQGYVSITYGIKGMCKSFICDRASGASALYFAVRAILEGECDLILAGGTEAPLTPFGIICYYETGVLASSTQNLNVYRPFDKLRSGTVLGEGSTVLILEKLEDAESRGANIYGKLYLGSMTTDADGVNNKNYQYSQVRALANANLSVDDIDVIYPEAAGTLASDLVEAEAIQEVFRSNLKVHIACPKASYGHLYGASTATDIAVGLLAAKNQVLPPTINTEFLDDGLDLNIQSQPVSGSFSNMLFSSRAREGSNVSMSVISN
ncbi:beta-ketoacyl-[acyl-carrier-protein] synthase family protein [Rickettsiella endosymbiont of Xylota segnis]|uniref:beta-ketoacyl-[acyl-carrier-protein] synthase family protein n=1 Tax=Rickettsiella endosymbiont of Xylota segnis TaxID=3066238 RepID=UPI0030CEAFF2